MANIIPPMLSSTPPPMDDDAMDENDDDDFGDYSTANIIYNSVESSEPIYNNVWEDGTFEFAVQKCEDFSDTPENKVSRLILDVATASSEHVAVSGRNECVDSFATPPMVDDQNVVSACQSDRSEDLNTIQLQSNPLSDGISQTCHNKTSNSFIGLQQMVSEIVSDVGSESDCLDHMSKPQSVSPNVMGFEEGLPECAAVSSVSLGPVIVSSASDNTFTTDYTCVSDDYGFKAQLPVEIDLTSRPEECEESSPGVVLNDDDGFKGVDITSRLEECEESSASVVLNDDNGFKGVDITSGPEEWEESSAGVVLNDDDGIKGVDITSGPEEWEESSPGVVLNDDNGFKGVDITSGPEDCEESSAGVVLNNDNGFKGMDIKCGPEDCEESSAGVVLNDDLNPDLHSECNIFQAGFQDFDQFEAFATFQDEVVTKVVVLPEEGQNQSESEHENVVSLTDSEFGFPSDDEDEFCEFASSSVSSLGLVPASVCETSAPSLAALPPASPDADGDSFATFQTASPHTSRVENTNQVPLADGGENVVTVVFPARDTCAVPVFTPEGSSEDTTVWTSLRDVDASNALTYQWINSTANKMLLASLGIDTRNILFGPKWGVNVPRFAANLSVSPLQPVPARCPAALTLATDATLPTSPAKLQAAALTAHSEVVVPDAQFDWTSSGLVNPLDCFERVERSAPVQEQQTINSAQWLSTVTSEEGISAEAARFIDQLSDISFVRSKTLVVPPYRPVLLHS